MWDWKGTLLLIYFGNFAKLKIGNRHYLLKSFVPQWIKRWRPPSFPMVWCPGLR